MFLQVLVVVLVCFQAAEAYNVKHRQEVLASLKLKEQTKSEVFARVKHLYTLTKHELIQLILEKEFHIDNAGELSPFVEPPLPHDVEEGLDVLVQDDVERAEDQLTTMTLGDDSAVGNVLHFDLSAAKAKIDETRDMLSRYYRGGDALVQSAGLQPGDGLYEQHLNRLADQFARAFVWNDKFVISVMGSSVAAGHDNCNYDSYERQMERLLAPVLKAANVELVVRNAGEGGGCGDSMENQIWCARHILGDDTDIAHYTWTYFEHGDRINKIHERWIRWVLLMKHAPVPMIFNTGGEDGQCTYAADPSRGLFKSYAKFGFNAVCLQAGIIRHGYQGKKWGAVGDGMHNFTRYAESSSDPFSDKATGQVPAARKRSLGVVFRNWHPGPLGFQVTSDAFSYIYLHAMQKAIGLIEDLQKQHKGDVTAFHTAAAQRWPKRFRLITKQELPTPLYCSPEVCSTEDPPACTSWEQPVYGGKGIRVVSGDDSLNPYKDKYKDTDRGWGVFTAPGEQLIPRAEANNPACLHLDHCGAIQGNAASGFLTLRLPRMELGRIVVCCMAGKSCGDNFAKAGTTFVFDGKPVVNYKVKYGKCVTVQDRWSGAVNDPGGHLYLGVFVNTSTTLQISQVITL